ncbi:hypothetical protein RI129_000085 [Pyrocoelia pectoralis]|uniref:Major facilitator superfamily domain-containing protein 12 n=1 Tax=Pyrocoelia pectoralis TaxID=417401 RepID=A0AAN7ZBG5_9COLE
MESTNRLDAVEHRTHYLSWFQRFSYSVGHVFNDLCAAFWFTYLLIFMRKVNGFGEKTAGELMLVGQVADGLATPFIGLECDKNFTWWICRYGKRKTWHLLGTICVLFSFPFIFNLCWGCHNSTEGAQVVYYSAFIIIFQFGWASVQISHLSLIPDLTPISSERIELNAFRYAFTVFSNIAVFIMMWMALDTSTGSEQISIHDAPTFKIVSFIILALGSLFSGIFHVGTKEKPNIHYEEEDDQHFNNGIDNEGCERDSDSGQIPNCPQSPGGYSENELVCTKGSNGEASHLRWKDWFFVSQFYFVGILYMGTRLTINLTQVYVPQYLQETLNMSKVSFRSLSLFCLMNYSAVCFTFQLIVFLFTNTFLLLLSNRKVSPTFRW